ncbi:MAG: NAD-dependent epimerase/dehydratase family protein [Candidatus Heimdallarchaeota archaeon]
MVKAIVTGGAGYIGYHLSKYLIEKDIEVTVFDNFSDYYSKDIKSLNANELEKLGATIIKGSILQKEDLNKAITNDCDYLFHFAAQPGIRYSTMNPQHSLQVNVVGTSHVLSAANEKNVKKIVVASSSSVFGTQRYLPIDELHPKNPISYYGVSKLATEKLVDVYRHLNEEADISIIRPFTVVGTRQRPDMALCLFVTYAFKGKKITIYGDGEQTRDWTHVENIVQAAYLMTTVPEAKNEDFNIGSGIRTSLNVVLDLISVFTKKELILEYKEHDRADVKDTLANITKAKELLGYKPEKSLRIAIKEFVEDYPNIEQFL